MCLERTKRRPRSEGATPHYTPLSFRCATVRAFVHRVLEVIRRNIAVSAILIRVYLQHCGTDILVPGTSVVM